MATPVLLEDWPMEEDYLDSFQDGSFANEIQKHPCLWDTSRKDFKTAKTMKAHPLP